MKKPVQVQDYEKDKDEDEGEVILTSLMGVPVRCKAISGMYHVNVLVLVNVLVGGAPPWARRGAENIIRRSL